MHSDIYKDATKLMGHKEDKPKKEIREVRTRKAKSGGYIHEHHHTHPDHHPMEEHTSPDQDAMVEHMLQHMGTPNPGEPDAGDAAAPSGAAPAGAAPMQPMQPSPVAG